VETPGFEPGSGDGETAPSTRVSGLLKSYQSPETDRQGGIDQSGES